MGGESCLVPPSFLSASFWKMALILSLEMDSSLLLSEHECPIAPSRGRVTHRGWVKCLSGVWFQIPGWEHLLIWLEPGDHCWSNQPWPGVSAVEEKHGCLRPRVWLWGKVPSAGQTPKDLPPPSKCKVPNYSESYWAFTMRQTLGLEFFL